MYKFIDFFPPKVGEVIAFVGCGGKTSLIEGIITEWMDKGLPVLHTTTTKIYPPEGRKIILGSDLHRLAEDLRKAGDALITAAAAYTLEDECKLLGLPIGWFPMLKQVCSDYGIFVEADGCRGQSIKLYDDHEPCLPFEADRIIILTGMDAFTCNRIEEKAHRYPLLQKSFPDISSYSLQERVEILFHPKGLIGKLPKAISKTLFLNKVTEENLEQAKMIGDLLLEGAGAMLKGVMIGNTYEKPMIYAYKEQVLK